MADIEIVTYQPHLRSAFEALNRAWIEQLFRIEDEDIEELVNAEANLIGSGGQIFFAFDKGAEQVAENVLGTIGVYIRGPEFHEIVKLGVRADAKGRGLGRKLVERAIEYIREKGASRAVILTNSRLHTAVKMYRDMGFVEVDLGYKPMFERCDLEFILPFEEQRMAA